MYYSERESAAALEDKKFKLSPATVNWCLQPMRITTPGKMLQFNKELDHFARLSAISMVLTEEAPTTRGVHALSTKVGYIACRLTVQWLRNPALKLPSRSRKKTFNGQTAQSEEVRVGEGIRFQLDKNLSCRRKASCLFVW
jgi:hypothetical protein